jgi:hypothetical protein
MFQIITYANIFTDHGDFVTRLGHSVYHKYFKLVNKLLHGNHQPIRYLVFVHPHVGHAERVPDHRVLATRRPVRTNLPENMADAGTRNDS